MDDETRRRILDEAHATLAIKDSFAQTALPSSDPLTRWREEAAKLEAKYAEGRREVREEEAERRRAAEANPVLWDQWFMQALRRHLPSCLDPSLEGIAQGVGGLYAELRHRADAQDKIISEQRKEIDALRLEVAGLAIKLAELRTDRVLAAMPLSGDQRSIMN
jgi:hypothetical protein